MNTSLIEQRLHDFHARAKGFRHSLGYPCNLNLDYLAPLQPILSLPLNNVGTWFGLRHTPLHSGGFEQEVVRFIARLYDLEDDADYHGYVTSGGTEANFYGLAQARDAHPDATLYFSDSSHYSIGKSARLLRLRHRVIASDETGEINYTALAEALSQRNKGEAAIISLNIGSTMRGAIDRVETVIDLLQSLAIGRFHIHCDAALFGMMLPFLPGSPCPRFSQAIDSLAISGHKFIGCPFPCGIVITRKRPQGDYIEYIHTADTTLLGSRNGHAPVLLWYALMTRGSSGLAREVEYCMANADYLQNRLTCLDYPHDRRQYSNIVCLHKPADAIIRKWNLATEAGWSHVVVMQHVSRAMLDEFLQDLIQSRG